MLQKFLTRIDTFQRHHRFIGFMYAVVKKYGDDEAGFQAALLTYYGFLSIFPLLLVLSTILGVLAGSHPHLQETVINSLTGYIPVLGRQLSEHVHTLHRTGVALVAGLLFTLYGARGIADAFRHGVNHIWQVPKLKRDSFPKSVARSLTLVFVGGAGFMLASLISTYASAVAGHGFWFRVLSSFISMFILFWVFILLMKLSLPEHIGLKQTRAGAASAAIGLVILQVAGSYLLGQQLRKLDALYSSFALALGLLFYIYLQAQMLYYSVEIATVKDHKLWPRSLTGSNLTDADKRVYARQVEKERVVEKETITTTFAD